MICPIRWKSWANKLKAGQLLRKIDGDPQQIARGYSLGIFIGMMPLVGVKAFIAVAIASALKWNKLAAGIGVFNINPLTAPFLFGLSYIVGRRFTGCTYAFSFTGDFSYQNLGTLFMNGSEILITLAIGGFLLGIPFAMAGYYISYFILRKYRKQID